MVSLQQCWDHDKPIELSWLVRVPLSARDYSHHQRDSTTSIRYSKILQIIIDWHTDLGTIQLNNFHQLLCNAFHSAEDAILLTLCIISFISLYAVCDVCTSMDRIMFEVCVYSKYTGLCVHLSYVPWKRHVLTVKTPIILRIYIFWAESSPLNARELQIWNKHSGLFAQREPQQLGKFNF